MTTRGTVVLLSTVLLIAWIGVATAGLFPNGPNPAVRKTLVDAGTRTKASAQQRLNNGGSNDTRPFRNTWVVEFNDLPTTSPEEFAQQHNVHVRRIGNTNKYSVRQKHDTNGLDVEKQNELSSDPRVRSIEFEIPRQQVLRQIPTTDPGLCDQWHLYNCPTASVNSSNINIAPAWEKGYTGLGVQIAIVDDGVETTHPDLAANYIAADSYDFNFDDPNPSADSNNPHGTSCAGLVAAPSNSFCGVGGAYNAKFSALRLIAAGTSDSVEASALSHLPNKNHIYSNSWGPNDDGKRFEGPGALTEDALSSTSGRDGRGNIFVWAGGNGRTANDFTTRDGYASHPNVICVSATDRNGRYASYSELGASVFIAAPGGDSNGGIYTTDLSGSNGYSAAECTSQFMGTSAATPIVAGAVALILEANPALTNRDVRRIIGLTAAKNDVDNELWFRNGAYHWVNYNYGFGLIDVDKAIAAAKTWTNLPAAGPAYQVAATPNMAIPENAQACVSFNYGYNVSIEYVALRVNIQHPYRGDVFMLLKSPAGTSATLLFAINDSGDNIQWTFYSYFFLDELSYGTWQICAQDMFALDNGNLVDFSFSVSGIAPWQHSITAAFASNPLRVPYDAQPLNITVTFTNDEVGIFADSITPSAIRVVNLTPTAVAILSSTSTSVTAAFTIDSSALGLGTFSVYTTEFSVQNKRLTSNVADVLIGELELFDPPPIPPPVAEPIAVAPPVEAPVDSNVPTAGTPTASGPVVNEPTTGRVSDATYHSVELAFACCATAFIMA